MSLSVMMCIITAKILCVFVCVFPGNTRWHYGYVIPEKSFSLIHFLAFIYKNINKILLCHANRPITKDFHAMKRKMDYLTVCVHLWL